MPDKKPEIGIEERLIDVGQNIAMGLFIALIGIEDAYQRFRHGKPSDALVSHPHDVEDFDFPPEHPLTPSDIS